jgi:hypothetical protein
VAETGPAPAAVGGSYSGELLLGLSNKRLEGLQRVLGEVLERLDNWEHKWAQGLGVDGHGGAARLWATVQRAWPASFCPLYRRVFKGGSRTPMRRRSRGIGAWYGGDVRWYAASNPVDGRRHGRLGLAMARAARGAKGVGRKAARRQGVPRCAYRQTKAGLGRHVRRAAVGRRGIPARRRARSRSRGKMFRTSPVQLRFSKDF